MGTTLLSLALLCAAAPPVEKAETPETMLYVSTEPSGAEVAADGKAQGKSPCLFVVPPGVHKMTIEVQLDQHYPQRQEVEVRGGRITRVELEMRPLAGPEGQRAHHTGPAASGDSVPDALKIPADGWEVVRPFLASQDATAAITKKLGGRIERLFNTVFTAHGEEVQVNVFECPTAGDAEKVHQAILKMKGDPAFCLRFGKTVVEFVGTFDAAFAKRAAKELGLEPAGTRQRHFVRLVVGTQRMTFQGQETTWEGLPKLLEKIPDRQHTVLELAHSSADVMISQHNLAFLQAANLAQQFGFEYLSMIGVHPLGSKGSPMQTVPEEESPGKEGVVLAVTGEGLVEVSLGSDDGLLKGHKLHVYRVGGGRSVYVGRIEVVQTEPDRAVCKIDPKFQKSPMQQGDRVASKIE